jgi:hypothetical protein
MSYMKMCDTAGSKHLARSGETGVGDKTLCGRVISKSAGWKSITQLTDDICVRCADRVELPTESSALTEQRKRKRIQTRAKVLEKYLPRLAKQFVPENLPPEERERKLISVAGMINGRRRQRFKLTDASEAVWARHGVTVRIANAIPRQKPPIMTFSSSLYESKTC